MENIRCAWLASPLVSLNSWRRECQPDFSLEMFLRLPLPYFRSVLGEGGLRMPRARQDWLRLSWTLIILLGLAAALSCASHPPGHDHHVGHPPLCTDTDSPVTVGTGRPTLSPESGTWPLSSKSLLPPLSLAALSGDLPLVPHVWTEGLSQSDTRTSVSPPIFLVVLRQ